MAEIKVQMLEVDLSTGKKKVVDVTQDVRKFLGGRGLGAKLLWDRVPPGADPLSPENILYFGIGPVTGLFGSVVNVSFKSPLTQLAARSCFSGHFGSELAEATYNAGLLITGKASKPVYLVVKDDDVEIKDASHLWGKLNAATQYQLKQDVRKELADQNFRTLSIGPAGERLVKNAGISHDFYHYAARLGGGAVMGSKNLKAIAIRGTKGAPYADHQKVFQMVKDLFHGGRLQKIRERRWGHTVSMPQRYYDGTEGIKNKQLGWHPICDQSNPLLLEQQYKVWGDSCSGCQLACKVPYMRRDPPLGPVVGELRHDDAGGWNANVMIPGYNTQVYLTPLLDNLGLDNEDVSGVVAWIMECYDRKLLTKDDLDGIDLTWGNLEAICALVEKIAYRQGIGNILAEGLKFAPGKIGRGSEKYAMTSKGVAITSYEPRGSMSDAVGLVVNPCGEIHGGRGNPETVMTDSMTACTFVRQSFPQVFGSVTEWGISALNAACGWDLTAKDWPDLAHRTSYMERCYSIREGYRPERDDTLPDRFFEETIYQKYGKPMVLDRAKFIEQRGVLYASYGLNPQGLPPQDALKRLGLEFTIPTLEKAIGHWA